MSDKRPHFQLFTDGACSGNPGPGGWAFILRDLASGDEFEAADGEAQTTNNRMEMLAVIKGLRRLQKPARVFLFSDSKYLINGLMEWMDNWKAKGWRRGTKPVKNLELWKELDSLRQTHDITAEWVPGHSDHPENERCDQLATSVIDRFR